MPVHNTKTQTQSQRSQELRKYFAPIIRSDVGNEDTRRRYNENLLNDGVLVSIAEAAMLRLSGKRAMISFVDLTNQYFIAGALDDEGDTIDDACTWFGCHNVNTAGGLCERTLSAQNEEREHPTFTVNDLLLDDQCKDQPYVDGTLAKYRFYAGTPITTKRNINVGTLFIFDDRPRPNGLNAYQHRYMTKSAERIMSHLEMRRVAKERHRLAYMSEGIAKFLQSKYEDDAAPGNEGKESSAKFKRSDFMTEANFETSGTLNDNAKYVTNEGGIAHSRQENTANRRKQGRQTQESPQDQIKRTLDIAAKLLCESLEIVSGGVAFFDTISETPSALDNDFLEPRMTESTAQNMKQKSSGEASETPGSSFRLPMLYEGPEDGPAKIMAEARSYDDTIDLSQVDSDLVRELIEHYPEGNVWYFDEKGFFTSLEQLEASTIKHTSSSGSLRRESQSQEQRDVEAKKISLRFSCRQLIFLPLWSAETKQWFSGCFVWTHSSIPVFTVSSEIGYLASFANSIMTELSRIDAIALNRVKSDFISSISHEFRSPLHGILASADFLQETDFTEAQFELISTIQSCGRTLLDTINHVLDFTKINFSEKTSNQKGLRHNAAISIHYSMTNIAVLCEEVVDGMIVSDGHKDMSEPTQRRGTNRTMSDPKSPGSGSHTPFISVSLDFEARDWSFMTMPGAIRRIIMNIFGNAQKYTNEGFISVSLRAVDGEMLSPDGVEASQPKTAMMILVVRDSGRGMSSEFLQRNLYTPFVQENTLSAGAGLGLSIVRSIVNQLSGSIKVRSVKNKGTEVEIRIPLERTLSWNRIQQLRLQPEDILCSTFEADECLAAVRTIAQGVTISLRTSGPDVPKTQSTPSMVAVQRYLDTWFGFQLQYFSTWASAETSKSALIICDELDYDGFVETPRYHDDSTPILMVCSLPTCLERRRQPLPRGIIGYLSKPIGPYKLARHLLDHLIRFKNSNGDIQQGNGRSLRQNEHTTNQTELPFRKVSRQFAQHIPTSVDPLKNSNPSIETRMSSNPDLTPLSILIVDDNEVNLKLLKKYLDKRQEDTVNLARDGSQALEAVQQTSTPYDLVFMDLSMPIMDGFESTRRIREHEAKRAAETGQKQDSFIVALTGLGAKESREMAEKCGTNEFLTKPLPFKSVGRLLVERSRLKFFEME